MLKYSGSKYVLFGGDTFLRTCDGSNPFSLIEDVLSSNIVCLNLETALKGERHKDKYISLSVCESTFSFIPRSVKILSIVNNHASDSGSPEMLAEVIEKQSKKVIGPTNPSVTNMRYSGMNLEFFGAYFSLPRLKLSYNGAVSKRLIRLLLESNAERKIVILHWGYEHTNVPAPFQRELAHGLIDAGANLIIGHHPHVPQGWEIYNGKSIFYSLGNFNFWQLDGEDSENNRWGYMVAYNYTNENVKTIPYKINDNYQPYPVSQGEGNYYISQIRHLSEAISEINDEKWFTEEYNYWYAREMKVWENECINKLSLIVWAKWMVWLCMPMQFKYYTYKAWSWLKICCGKDQYP